MEKDMTIKKELKIINFFKTNLCFFIILLIIVLLLHIKSINYGFVTLDEDSLISRNAESLSDIKNITNFFLSSCYLTNTSSYYRPVLLASFAIETCLFGLNTQIYHITNILLLVCSLYLMYIFLLQLNINHLACEL